MLVFLFLTLFHEEQPKASGLIAAMCRDLCVKWVSMEWGGGVVAGGFGARGWMPTPEVNPLTRVGGWVGGWVDSVNQAPKVDPLPVGWPTV